VLLVVTLVIGFGGFALAWFTAKGGCPGHVAVDFSSAPGGTYRVETVAGATSGYCEFELPVPAGWSPKTACQGMGLRPLWGKNVGIVSEVTVPSTPEHIRLRVWRDKKVVFDKTVFPRYDQNRCIGELRPTI